MAKKNARKVPEEIVLAPIKDQAITDTIEKNYMPYAMSVIVSRAIPEIDGFKPSQRKLLYTMYKMGLLTGSRIKSANVVGQTMRLNPRRRRDLRNDGAPDARQRRPASSVR